MDALRKVGASVVSLHTVGRGCPDILVGYRGKNYLMEIKVKGKTLRDNQQKWADDWKGAVLLVRTPTEAIEAIV